MESARTLLQAGFDALPAETAMLDDTGAIVYTNRAWREFGDSDGLVDFEEATDQNYLDVCDDSDDEDATIAAAGIRSVLHGDRDEFSFEYPCHTDDRKQWFTMRAIPFTRDGASYVLVMHLDITARKRTEMEVQAHNERLTGLTSILSHDLRNPLTVALGRAELMDGEHADAVVDALARMETILGDALVLARGGDIDDIEPVSLQVSVSRAWSHVKTDDATVSVTESVTLDADADLLGHLFENLFRNAVEHGGTDVAVTVGVLDDGFYVEDDGPGIDRDDRDSVFEAGYTTNKADGGTGLGLPIVKRVADAHGWQVAVSESADGGARFEITEVEIDSA